MADLPVIVWSSSPADAQGEVAAQATRYLEKPGSLDEYMNIGRVIAEYLEAAAIVFRRDGRPQSAQSSRNCTSTFAFTGTGLPFLFPGSKRHWETALIACLSRPGSETPNHVNLFWHTVSPDHELQQNGSCTFASLAFFVYRVRFL